MSEPSRHSGKMAAAENQAEGPEKDAERQPQKFTSVPYSSADRPFDVFRALALQGLHCWRINLRGALAYGDPEFFHQFRVTLRRLGTLLKLFKPILPTAFHTHWLVALKDVARQAEDIRDLDVMLESILEPMLAETDAHRGNLATKQAIQHCREARHLALELFIGKAHAPALQSFENDLGKLKPTGNKRNRQPIVDFAEKRIGKMYRRSLERLNATRKDLTPETGHALRISLKHLRYACEFFAPVFDEKAMQKYAKQISLLQDGLGAAHDLHVTVDRLQALAAVNSDMEGVAESVEAWHGGERLPPLGKVIHQVEDELTTCLPWCGECKRRHGSKYHRGEER